MNFLGKVQKHSDRLALLVGDAHHLQTGEQPGDGQFA